MHDYVDVPPEVEGRVRLVCEPLPEAYEEHAWVGRRWRVRKRTFAHILMVDKGWPPAYARAARSAGPLCLLTFRASKSEAEALDDTGPPFFRPPWGPEVVGLTLAADADWDEVAELLIESYCRVAPRKLVSLVRATYAG